MTDPSHSRRPLNICFQVILLFFLILLPYINSFNASWHLDDYVNITWNPKIKIDRADPDSLWQAMHANPGKQDEKLYRPLPTLSFALNWYTGKDRVFGYHAVNFIFHWLSVVFLFLAVLSLYQSPRLKGQGAERAFFVAWLTAALWAINPIQTQAVTYIVQRMASMAACFAIGSIFFYIKGRLASKGCHQSVLFFFAAASLLASFGSKENAATVPLSLFFLECVFFQDLSRPEIRRRIFITGVAGGITIILLAGLLFIRGNPFSILNTYATRDFTLIERILTQSRVLIFHLSQILYPIPSRFSIVHDIELSRSLMDPWTTAACLAMIAALGITCLATIRKHPLLSFAIGFFFINHLVESTLLPLEMIFEHRNYLPSMFIFLPVSAGLYQLYDYYRGRNRLLTLMIPAFTIVVLIGFGIGTYIRNMSWASEKTLWEDAMLKAPKSSRPLHNLAWGHYEEIGDTRTALGLYLKSLTLRDDSISRDAATYNNLAIIYFNAGKHDEAIRLWQKAIRSSPKFSKMYYKISEALTKLGKYKSAERYLDIMMTHVPDTVTYLNLKGLILIKTGKPSDALKVFRKSLTVRPSNYNTWTNIGICFGIMDHHRHAQWFLRRAWTRSPKNPYVLLWLSATALSSGDSEKGRFYIKKLVDVVEPEKMAPYLREVSLRRDLVLPDLDLVIPEIATHMENRVQSVSRFENQLKTLLNRKPDV